MIKNLYVLGNMDTQVVVGSEDETAGYTWNSLSVVGTHSRSVSNELEKPSMKTFLSIWVCTDGGRSG
jgi:hypothetical protein